MKKVCSIDGCNNKYFTSGYCSSHYKKFVTKGRKHKDRTKDSTHFTIDRTGEVYKTKQGTDITIVVYRNYLDCDIMLETGEILENRSFYRIKTGIIEDSNYSSVKGVGYMGVGKYPSAINGIQERPYIIRKRLITRCYGSKREEVKRNYGD